MENNIIQNCSDNGSLLAILNFDSNFLRTSSGLSRINLSTEIFNNLGLCSSSYSRVYAWKRLFFSREGNFMSFFFFLLILQELPFLNKLTNKTITYLRGWQDEKGSSFHDSMYQKSYI